MNSPVEAPDPDDVMNKLWPTTPDAYTPEHVAAAVRMARELIRFANHATLDAPSKVTRYASQLGDVVGASKDLAARLVQLTEQLAGRARVLAEEEGLTHFTGGDPRATLADASGQLGLASIQAATLAQALKQAHNGLGQVGHPWGDEDTED